MKILFSFLLITAILLAPMRVLAQETEIAVTPAIIDAPVAIGQSVTKSIRITNGSNSALPVSVEVQPAVLESELVSDADAERYRVQQWVRFAESTYVFEPGQTKEIEFTITVPFTALPGGHYAQISIRGLSLEQDIDGQTTGLVFPEIGVPLLITVPGEIVEDARLAGTGVFPFFVTPKSNIMTKFLVENSGTVHNLVSSRIIVERNGEFLYDVAIGPSVVLPATQKTAVKDWTTPGYGKYQVSIELKYGNKAQVYRSEPETIYVLPPLSSLLTLALFVWASLYLWPRRRQLKAATKVLFGQGITK